MPVIQNHVGITLDRIVVATDFSELSEVAAAYAKRLAKRFSSNLILAHVIDLSVTTISQSVRPLKGSDISLPEFLQAGIEVLVTILDRQVSSQTG